MAADIAYRVFVGLGNPGRKYERTRHNIGYRLVQKYADRLEATMKEEKKFQAKVAKSVNKGVEVHLIQPLTFMNESGMAVRKYLDFYRLGKESLVVIVDDIALAFGEMRLRDCGGSGGHNGLKSIQAHLGTQDYTRLRMGVGAPKAEVGEPLSDYVLGGFTSVEERELPDFLNRGQQVLQSLLADRTDRVMNEVNKRKLPKEEQEIKYEKNESKPL